MPQRQPRLATALIARLPFFYGWIVLAVVCCAGLARQGPAVATLSIFVTPMTSDFGWSRAAISGAVSLGGILGALISPVIGPMADRQGARVMLCLAVLLTGISTMLLSQVESLLAFYLFFCIGRMNFAGPFDIGIYGALNSWFVAKRGIANAIVGLAHMAGLVVLPLVAHFAMTQHGWRVGWLAVGVTVLLIGLLPVTLLLVRRPEDVGLLPDGMAAPPPSSASGEAQPRLIQEPAFTRSEAMRTPAFWLLSLYTMAVFPVQAGVSLHQASHAIERGLSPGVAAAIVSTFSLTAALSGFAFGLIARRIGVRVALALGALLMGCSALMMIAINGPLVGYLAGCLFGAGIGCIITVLPLAWADYFGRASFGAIRGVALTMQVTSQAAGPLLSGVLHDLTGSYVLALTVFAGLSLISAALALVARPPAPPGPVAV